MKKTILLTILTSSFSFAQAGIRMDCNLSERAFRDGPPQRLSVEYSDQWYFQVNTQNVADFELTQNGKSILVRYEDYNRKHQLMKAQVEMHCTTSVGGYADWSTKNTDASTPDTATYYCKCASN